jgi:hypothetical protein
VAFPGTMSEAVGWRGGEGEDALPPAKWGKALDAGILLQPAGLGVPRRPSWCQCAYPGLQCTDNGPVRPRHCGRERDNGRESVAVLISEAHLLAELLERRSPQALSGSGQERRVLVPAPTRMVKVTWTSALICKSCPIENRQLPNLDGWYEVFSPPVKRDYWSD